MKPLILSLFTILSMNSLANVDNYIEIDISKWDFDKPKAGAEAGTLNFSQVQLSWDGMSVGINNNGKIFDSKLFYRGRYIGISGPNLNLGFNLKSDNTIKEIESMDIINSKLLINPQFFSFNGEQFKIKNLKSSKLSLNKFNLYCAGSEGLDLTTGDGIVAGCLTESIISGQNEGDLAGTEIEYKDTEGQNPIYLSSMLDSIELFDGKISANINKNLIDLPAFKIKTKETVLTCSKDKDLTELDSEKLKADCLNSIDLKSNGVVFTDREEGTEFHIDLKNLTVVDESLNVSLPSINIADEKSETKLHSVNINCQKSESVDLLDLQYVINECFKGGSVSIGSITSKEEKEKIEQIYKGYQRHPTYRKTKRVETSKSSVSNLKFDFINNTLYLNADLKLLFNFKIAARIRVMHYPEEGIMRFKLLSAKIPVPIAKKKIFMHFLEKNLRGSFISYDDDVITIKI